MSLMRQAKRVLLGAAVCLPALAHAQDNQKAHWTLGPAAPAAIKLYKNQTFTTTSLRLTVCFEHYSASDARAPPPAILVGVEPSQRDRLRIDLGGCGSASYLIAPDADVTLTTTAAAPGAVASGSYQIAIP